ncbi:MAG: hypothetical protein JNM63_16560 [Spirochaetia bacterium]|nr:hypothetical protein [Spirochaetia bacterium]
MGFLFSGWFWGAVVVLIGVAIILKAVFDIDIPIFRIVFGVILILFGVRLIIGLQSGSPASKPRVNVFFNEERIRFDPAQKDYNVIFGSAEIDLREATAKNEGPIHINTVFGKTVVLLPAKVALKAVVNSAFAEARLPNGNRDGVFGEVRYQSENYVEGKAGLDIRGNVVFGQLVFKNE